MSPKSGGRAQRRQRRNLWISVIVVVAISVGSFAAVFAAKWSPRLGLDLAGGVAVVYTAEGHNVSQADLDETVNILNLRVNSLGVSGAEVQTTGKNQISVSIPGVTDAQQVLDQIGQTARMYFRPVECFGYPQAVPKGSKGKAVASGRRDDSRLFVVIRAHGGQPGRQHLPPARPSNNVPPDTQYAAYPSTSVDKPGYATSTVLLPGPQRRVRPVRPALRARAGADDGAFDRQRPGHAEPDGRVGGRLHAGRLGRLGAVGQGGGRRTSTSCSGSSSTVRCTRRRSSSRARRASRPSTAGARSRGA